MQEHFDSNELASERTLLAAERTFSAWIRTGLAAVGGGLAIVRAFVDKGFEYLGIVHVIGGLLVMLGASIFIYAIVVYRRASARLMYKGSTKNSFRVLLFMTVVLLIVAALIFWISLL